MLLPRLVLAALVAVQGAAARCADGYATAREAEQRAAGAADDELHVHLVAHTHDDVGWLKTVDQYYYGANNSIQTAGVQYTLDTVVQELLADPNRTFTYVEIAFFYRWYYDSPQAVRDQVKMLVAEQRLTFTNGGWCMHDEASTHYVAMVEQMALGLQWLESEFGVRPTVGWQIDPFGHSRTHASLLSDFGFDSLYFWRMDYQNHERRALDRSLELMWHTSPSKPDEQIFTGGFYAGYGPPDGLCFDSFCNDDPIMDDPGLEDNNVDYYVKLFVDRTMERAHAYSTNHILFTMGSDFQYMDARMWYKNLDKLIHYVNAAGLGVRTYYSSPANYTAAVLAAQANGTASTRHRAATDQWPTKSDDFFPYADTPYSYWTGYFTSRPALKRYVRIMSNYLQVARQVRLLHPELGSGPFADTGALRMALGVAQHHDAVSGTSKQHVADDYAKRLAAGHAAVQPLMTEWVECPLANVSDCAPTTGTTSGFTMRAYNPMGNTRRAYIEVPIDNTGVIRSASINDGTIPAQVDSEGGRLFFAADLPASGFATFKVELNSAVGAPRPPTVAPPAVAGTLSSDKYALQYDASGAPSKVTNLASNVGTPLVHDFLWYNGSAGNNVNSSQASGAYIFRPNGTAPHAVGDSSIQASCTDGAVVQYVRRAIGDWTTVEYRLWQGASHVEIDYTVGPIPIDDGLGKEVVSRFTASALVGSNGTFSTDANGREVLQRKRNWKPDYKVNMTEPVAGNFFPVNTAILLQSHNTTLGLLNDRSQGGGSLNDGQVELMVHRRLLHDDGRGVGEALNETGTSGLGLVIRAKHRLILDNSESAAELQRFGATEIMAEPVLLFANSSTAARSDVLRAGVSNDVLPRNVHLVSLEQMDQLEGKPWLVRLAHIFATGESSTWSKPVEVNLVNLFGEGGQWPNRVVDEIVETDLSGVRIKQTADGAAVSATTVTMAPMEIRAWRVTFSSTTAGAHASTTHIEAK